VGNKYDMKQAAYTELCKQVKLDYNEQVPQDIVYCGTFEHGDMQPCHAITARNNIDKIARGMIKFRDELVEKADNLAVFDELVKVRLGHGTWASYDNAKQVREAKMHVDINLASNLATQAYTWPVEAANGKSLDRPKFMFAQNPASSNPPNTAQSIAVHELVSTTSRNFHTGVEMKKFIRGFSNHGFLKLFIAGVRIQLGSDGTGIEHSNIPLDYKVAAILISNFKESYDKVAVKPGGDFAASGLPAGDLWAYNLIKEWESDTHREKLGPTEWTIEKLLSYGAARQHEMTIREDKKALAEEAVAAVSAIREKGKKKAETAATHGKAELKSTAEAHL